MSLRYVWSKSNITRSQLNSYLPTGRELHVDVNAKDSFWSWSSSGSYSVLENGPVYIRYGSDYSISNGGFAIEDSTLVEIEDGTRILKNGNGFKIAELSSSDTIYWGVSSGSANKFDRLYQATYRSGDNVEFYLTYISSSGIGEYFNFRVNGAQSVTGNGYVYALAKGTSVGTASNTSSTAYPPRSYAPKLANIWP